MKKTKDLLIKGNAEGAIERFARLLQTEPAQTGALSKSLTQHLLGMMSRFYVRPVIDFCEMAPLRLPAPVVEAMMQFLGSPVERAAHWLAELKAVTRERLAREARGAINIDELKTAHRRCSALIASGDSDAERRRLAGFVCRALADLHRDIARSEKVIRELAKDDAIKAVLPTLVAEFEKARKTARGSGLEESNREWTQALNSAVASILEYCPGKRTVGEPTVEEMQKFTEEMTAVLRAGFGGGDDESPIDALKIVAEFCPCDPPDVESLAGVEPRMFLSLGGRAKLTAVRSLERIGESQLVRKRVLALANSPLGQERRATFATVMGGLRRDEFLPYLMDSLKRVKHRTDEEPMVDALGRIADPECGDALMSALRKAMKKAIDPREVARAKMLVTALGRIARRKGLEPRRRQAIVTGVIRDVGARYERLTWHVVKEMFATNTKSLDGRTRDWAARQTVRAMFHIDTGDDLGAAAKSPAGYRKPMITALNRLGKGMLPVVLECASHHAMNYGGALSAFAEVMQKIGDARAVPVLDNMLRTAFLHSDDEEKSQLFEEKVMDAATGEMRGLDRDDIVHTLLYTLDKIGGEEGHGIVLGYADQVGAGQIAVPGQASASFLTQAKLKQGTLGEHEAHGEPGETVDTKDVMKAFQDAKGGMFTKERARIRALSVLGRARKAETVGAVLKCLESKEALVRNAAETALVQFVTPPPTPKQFEKLMAALLAQPKLLREGVLHRLMGVIEKHFPKNAPYAGIYKNAVSKALGKGEVLYRFKAAIRKPGQPTAAVEGAEGDEEGGGSPGLATAEERLTLLQQKRAYLEERRSWIKAGKRGPAPKPPAGMN